MSFEHQNGGRGDPGPRGDPGRAPPGSGEAWGWALVQRDWSLRQREPSRSARSFAGLVAHVDAAIARLRRLARGALRGIVHGSAARS